MLFCGVGVCVTLFVLVALCASFRSVFLGFIVFVVLVFVLLFLFVCVCVSFGLGISVLFFGFLFSFFVRCGFRCFFNVCVWCGDMVVVVLVCVDVLLFFWLCVCLKLFFGGVFFDCLYTLFGC